MNLSRLVTPLAGKALFSASIKPADLAPERGAMREAKLIASSED